MPFPSSKRRRRALLRLPVVLVLVGAGLVACTHDPGPAPALQAFVDGWSAGHLDGVAIESPDGTLLAPSDVLTQVAALAGDLDAKRVKATVAAPPQAHDGRASGSVNVEWTVVDGVGWPYQTTVDLHQVDGAWRIVFTPATVHPQLKAGEHLAVDLVGAQRGAILDGSGGAIVSPRPVIIVGIEPGRVKDQAALIAALDSAFRSIGTPIDLSDLPDQLAAAKPNAFVTVVTLRREAYEQIRSRIHDLPGTVFREATLPLAPTRAFARALLGTVGDVTREQLDAAPGRYFVGEQIGQSGLQESYDDLLRGRPGLTITVGGAQGASGQAAAPAEVLYHADPTPGTALRTSLDQKVQSAADAALSGQSKRAALVAVRVSDGAILAVANGPNGGEVNLAFTATAPPGSAFKMVTALAVLRMGVTPDTPVACPKTFTVDGRTFTNSGGEELGTVPFRTDFAQSCNTAFASLAVRLGRDGLAQTAASLGIGTTWNLGVPVFTGSVGVNESTVDAAAAAFGQGTTLVSPVSLAVATAAVARGSWRTPSLLVQLPSGAPTPTPSPGPAGTPPADGTALQADAVTALHALMREVVRSGTATALADVPGQPVYAKTGTAEFDNNPAHTHAWTIGWQGDIAFAVFVENGGSGAGTAVPIAESFLRGLG
ncbi:MAG TPA: penicillin-binding transpeptidase domain-containing protein [Micromonosporaceae bacterium]